MAAPSINRLLQSPPTRKRWVAPDTAGLWRSSHAFDESITDASPWLRPKVP